MIGALKCRQKQPNRARLDDANAKQTRAHRDFAFKQGLTNGRSRKGDKVLKRYRSPKETLDATAAPVTGFACRASALERDPMARIESFDLNIAQDR
ncbi:MAG: hypothetical protein QNK42_03540 [Pseudodonghicola sp.]|nr:hypothetical protein [Pseudodonghicola sp.]